MQCHNCKHYFKGSRDSFAGPGEPPRCEAFDSIYDHDLSGHVSDLLNQWFTTLAARLSQLNNCPFFEDRYPRPSILNVKPADSPATPTPTTNTHPT